MTTNLDLAAYSMALTYLNLPDSNFILDGVLLQGEAKQELMDALYKEYKNMSSFKYIGKPDDLKRFLGKTIINLLLEIDDKDSGYEGDVKSVLFTFADGDLLKISGSEEYHIAFEAKQENDI